MDDAQRQELADSLRQWPPEIREMAEAWPPGAKVTAAEDRDLLIPAPGIVGRIASYVEGGIIGVRAPSQGTFITQTGYEIKDHEEILGHCRPEWIELLEYDAITPEDIRDIIRDIEEDQ